MDWKRNATEREKGKKKPREKRGVPSRRKLRALRSSELEVAASPREKASRF